MQHLLERGGPPRDARPGGEQPAIIYDSPLAGQKRTLTYHALQVETQMLAAILRNVGVEKGDRVVLYIPMLPEAA
jgi:propionyl-CoA synthetase